MSLAIHGRIQGGGGGGGGEGVLGATCGRELAQL